MRKNTFSMYGKAIDSEGQEHIVTVVGLYEQFKEEITVTTDTPIMVKATKMLQGTISYTDKIKVRTLSFGSSICHPDDEFDVERGIELAEVRAETNPIGKLTSTDLTMLTKDMCNMLVFSELSYIINNIDEYIS